VPGALDGIRILDLTWGSAGPLGVLLLAEQGADVIKVEPPGGDPFRSYPGYKVWTRSRRSVELDLKSPDGVAAFKSLCATADVVVESFRPGVMDRLGLGYDALHAEFPHLVYCSVPAWPPGHRKAGRPGYDALVQAAAGQQWEQPGWRPGPIFLPMPMPSMGTIFLVPSGILAGLLARERIGRGQHVSTSLLQGVFLYTTQIWQYVEKADAAFHELMAKTYPPGVHQGMIFECAEREYLHVSVMSGLAPKQTLDKILGVEPPPAEELEGLLPLEQQLAMNNARRDAFKRWKRDELVEELRANNHAVEPIITMEQALSDPHPQLDANNMVVEIDDPDFGPLRQIGVPINLLGTPGGIQGAQPRVGEHTDEVLAEAPTLTPWAAPKQTSEPRPESRGPLDGLRCIDFGQYLAGPFGPMILSDLGMDVIKVEPVTGDGMRMAGKPFFGCQRGKRDIALNIKEPEGLEIALELVRRADVVHHNMTRGTATRLGIDYEACKAVKPDIIYCNTYAYGLEGPLSHFGGLDPLYQAATGLEYEAGATHLGNDPLYYRYGMADAGNAMLSVVGVLAALVHRDKTGEGQELWTSLLDAGAVFASDAMLRADGTPVPRPRLDHGQTGFGPEYRLYETQDGWVQVAALKSEHWDALCTTLGVDPSLDHRTAEVQLEMRFRTKTAVSWSRFLDDTGVANEVAIDPDGGDLMLFDADHERLGLVVDYEHAMMGALRQFGNTMDFSDTRASILGAPPRVGEDTRQVLKEVGAPREDALRASSTVYWPDDEYTAAW
jgi:crotonobetainyl-CoA:carnitine CoA-transferase CaiB-like acyl-CoA transferase